VIPDVPNEHTIEDKELIKFVSFEETLCVLAALATAAVAFKLFHATVLTSGLMGALAAAAVAYVTFSEFTFANDSVTYRSRFQEIEYPLSHVKRVGMKTFWLGLPGHTFIFVMRRPPAPVDGNSIRTGLVSWPSAGRWVEAVNSAIQKSEAENIQ
jgi:hypothetical protein